VADLSGALAGQLAVVRARPASAKGIFVKSCTLSLTMSPPVRLDLKEFGAN